MNTDNTLSPSDKIVQHLQATKKEIEQFLYDLSLESTDAESRYEKLKEELKSAVKEIKESLNRKDSIPEDLAIAIQFKLSAIDEHLEKPNRDALGQAKQFSRLIQDVTKEIGKALSKDGVVNEFLEDTFDQLQRYRLKFKILKLRLALGSLRLKYAGEEMQHQLSQKVDALSIFIRECQYGAKEKLRKFRHMVNKAYSDMGKLYS
jgi:hypothetical protein